MPLLQSARRLYWRIQITFGAVICPECGSRDIVIRGIGPDNRRWECKTCGTATGVWC
jgi:transposase-like protein